MPLTWIDHITRLRNSVNGNPRYVIHFTDGSKATTMSDAGFCYAITNSEYYVNPVSVELSPGRRVVRGIRALRPSTSL